MNDISRNDDPEKNNKASAHAAWHVSFFTFLSRILGMLRDTCTAHAFGSHWSVDAFLVAFKIPNLMRNLFAEGAFTQAWVPVLLQSAPDRETRLSLMRACLGFLIILSLTLTVLLCTYAKPLVLLFAQGYEQDPLRLSYTIHFLRIMSGYLLCMSISAFWASVLNAYGKFGAAACAPMILNIVLIGASYTSHKLFASMPVESQAWGVCVAGWLQVLWMMIYAKKHRLCFLFPSIHFKHPGIQTMIRRMLPMLFVASLSQISLMLQVFFSSFLVPGSMLWLYQAERLAYFPLGVFGVALATVALPDLCKTTHQASFSSPKSSHDAFSQMLFARLDQNLWLAIPAAFAMCALSQELMSSIFFYGAYTWFDVKQAARALSLYAIGIPAFMLIKMCTAAFSAKGDVRTPVRIGVGIVLVNIAMNAWLVQWGGHAGLALATSIASWIHASCLLGMLKARYHITIPIRSSLGYLFLSGIMTWVLIYVKPPIEAWGAASSPWIRWGHLLWMGFLCCLIYFSPFWHNAIRRLVR